MISSQPNKVEAWLETLKNTDKPVIVFTTGVAGRSFCNILMKHGVKITCFADNSLEKVDKSLMVDETMIRILDFQNTLKHYPDAYIVIPPRNYLNEIMGDFIMAGYDKNKLINVDFDVLNYNPSDELCKKVYGLLTDERSKSIFTDKYNFLKTGDVKYLGRTHDVKTMYFDEDILSLSGSELFVDGGGFTGDTFMSFIVIAKSFERYYLCEPDPANISIAKDKLSGYDGIEFVPMGLWSKRDVLAFSVTAKADYSYFRMAAHGDIRTSVTSIDEILNGKPVTFIKMDIEGAELEALKGAVNSIKKYKPKLAICAYHKVSDFIDIPLLIHDINPVYKLYLRHYSTNREDTVCYAV